LLRDEDSIEFHIIGEGVKLNKLKEKTVTCKNIRFFGWQPQNRMSEIYSYCNIEIIPLHYGVIGNNVPSKVALALACGKPILNIVEDSYYSQIFERNGIGFSVTQKEVEKAKYFLLDIAKNKTISFDNKKCVDFAEKTYSKNNIDKIINCCESMV